MPLYGRKMMFATCLVAGLGIVFEGYDQGVMSGVNIAPNYIKEGGIVAIYYLGTLVGALGIGALSDRIGRNWAVEIAGLWSVLGQALEASAQNANWMLCARVIAGIGTGGIAAVIPVWSSELVSYKNRGAAMAFYMSVNFAGISASYWLEYLLAFINNGDTQVRWRFPLAFQLIFVLSLMVAMLVMPESPRYDIGNGRKERGLRTLSIFRGEGDIDHPEVVAEYEEIQAAVELEKEYPCNSFFHMATGYRSGDLHLGRRVLLVVYAPELFQVAGFGKEQADLLTGFQNMVCMVCCLGAIFTMDKFGRRKALMIGGVGQAICFCLLGALSLVAADQHNDAAGAAAGSFIFIFNAVFAFGWLAVPWVYTSEIFPLVIWAKGNAFGIVGWSIGCGTVGLATPTIFGNLGPKAFFIFGGLNVLAIAVVYCFVPEVACRTLEEIHLLFASKSPFVWETEKKFQELKLQHSDLVHGAQRQKKCSGGDLVDREDKAGVEHVEQKENV